MKPKQKIMNEIEEQINKILTGKLIKFSGVMAFFDMPQQILIFIDSNGVFYVSPEFRIFLIERLETDETTILRSINNLLRKTIPDSKYKECQKLDYSLVDLTITICIDNNILGYNLNSQQQISLTFKTT
jgi:hypothetical protein